MPWRTLGLGGDDEPRYPDPLQQEQLLDSSSRRRSESSRRRLEPEAKQIRRATFGRFYDATLGRYLQPDPRSLEVVYQKKHSECQALERREARLKEEIESTLQLQKETEEALRDLKMAHSGLRGKLESMQKKKERCAKQQQEILQHFITFEEQRLRRRAARASLRA